MRKCENLASMPVCTCCEQPFPLQTRTVKQQQVPLKQCAPCRAAVCERVKKYNKTKKGKINMHNSNTSVKGKERQKRFNGTRRGRAKIVRGRTSDKGKARKEKELRELREDDGKRLAFSLCSSLGRLWHGRERNAPILWRNTEFNTTEEVIAHLYNSTTTGLSMLAARQTTEVEHCIPVNEYDHNIPGNPRRCHSKANLRALPRVDNCEKAYTLDRVLCLQVGEEHWPIEWNGVLPDRVR